MTGRSDYIPFDPVAPDRRHRDWHGLWTTLVAKLIADDWTVENARRSPAPAPADKKKPRQRGQEAQRGSGALAGWLPMSAPANVAGNI